MNKKLNIWQLTPPQILVLGFAVIIFIGAGLLTLPICFGDGSFDSFYRCAFYCDFGNLCDRACCCGYGKCLYHVWSDRHRVLDSSWRT